MTVVIPFVALSWLCLAPFSSIDARQRENISTTDQAQASSSPANITEVPKDPISEFEVFFVLRRLVNELHHSFDANNTDAQQSLNDMNDAAEFLLNKWRRALGSGETPREYLMSLTYDVYLLEGVKKEQNKEKAIIKLKDAAADLRIKADHCSRNENLNPKIKVKVLTKNSQNNDSHGYQVWFVQKGMEDVTACYDNFNKFSSPTDEKELVPGGYFVWAKKGSTTTERIPKRIGGDGKKEIEIDLLVP